MAIVGYAKSENLIAFPGAEGFGRYTVGGRGGKVVTVTNLEDYKTGEAPIEGSLRWALEQHKRTESVYSEQHGENRNITVFTPLTVVFNVSGTIWLKEDLKIKRDSLTIAGQTAPGDGICIAGRSVIFNGATGGESFYYGPNRTDLIVRYIRFRPGIPRDASGNPTTSFVTYAVDMENYQNVIFDHCSMSWANEEVLATYDTKNVTFQWNIISEGLYCAYHKKGLRAYGGVWGGQYASYHHNLIAHQNSRTPRFNGSRAHDTIAVVEYRNNVIYNWGNSDGACGGEIEIADGRSEINLFNNYYKGGPATSTSNVSYSNKGNRIIQLYGSSVEKCGQHYIAGNTVLNYPTVTADNWNFGVQFKSLTYNAENLSAVKLNNKSPEIGPWIEETADQAYANVLANAGAILPFRDAHDSRLIKEIKGETPITGKGTLQSFVGENTVTNSTYYNQVKGIIDDPEAVGGWPIFTTGTAWVDTDGDGMPDDWEIANNLDPNNPEDGNGIDLSALIGTGYDKDYTNLEMYLNSIVQYQNFLQAPFNLKATLSNNTPSLTWQDVSDSETGYEIQRSVDGGSFATIATIAANSTTYIDNSAPVGSCTYQVRATTSDLESVFSNTATVTTTNSGFNENKIEELKVYPNPVVDNLNIESKEEISQVEIFDLSGRLIQNTIANENKVSVSMQQYPKGIYSAVIKAASGNQSVVKVVK